MIFSLVICTFMREKSLRRLLESVYKQTVFPDEILIIDGSINDKTKIALENLTYKNLSYFKVDENERGLTKQRNFGISKLNSNSEIVCFLDDDTVLKEDYFEKTLDAFSSDTKIVGVGGVAINENRWIPKQPNKNYNKLFYYELDGFVIKESLRNILRNIFRLQSNLKPGLMPRFSHSRTFNYPLNNKIYEVDLLVGMSFSFKKKVLDIIKFSDYFEGYGLYEDADFSIRVLAFGKNVIATGCQLNHYHDENGRPNKFKYGKMVVINGWYVWRLKYKNPSLKYRLKWNTITVLLMFLKFMNIFTTKKRKESLTEFVGRFYGLVSLIFKKPKIKYTNN